MSWKNIALSLLLVAFFVSLWAAIQQTDQYRSQVQKDRDDSYKQAADQSRLLADSLSQAMQEQEVAVNELAKKLSEEKLAYRSVDLELQRSLERHKGLHGLSVSFEPFVYDNKSPLHAPYYRRIDGQIVRTTIEETYNYTKALDASVWYTNAVKTGKPGWYSIYSRISLVWVVAYSAPFYKTDPDTGERLIVGVVTGTNSFGANLRELIQTVDLGEEGYISIQNDLDQVIYYPDQDVTGMNVREVLTGFDEETFSSTLAKTKAGEFQQIAGPEKNDRADTWAIFQPLHPNGWTLISIVSQDLLAMEKDEKIRLLINIGLMYALCAVIAIFLLIRLDLTAESRVWLTSVSVAFILLFTILWIWYVIYTNPMRNGEHNAIVNNVKINEQLTSINDTLDLRDLPPVIPIPTGIMIQNMTLTNKSTTLSGYVWQKYPANTPQEDIQPPQFIDLVGSPTTGLRERYRIAKEGETITVGWFFSVEIRQYFDVTKYPLDRATVKIHLEPAVLNKNYVLVPDLDSYEMLGPTQKPGLSTDLKIPGWNIRGSYFSLLPDQYNSNFGNAKELHKELFPSLTFNVQATRNIVFPIVTYCILIYVVVIQAFGIAVLKIRDSFQVLSVAAALFLVVAITHTALRNDLASNSAIYLEYYFILLYLAILASSVTALLRAAEATFFLIHYRDNILTKTLFWPSFLGTALIITLLLFYPGLFDCSNQYMRYFCTIL